MFWLRVVNLHWFAWSYTFMRYMSSWRSVFILWWFPSGAFLESFSHAHTLWYWRDSLMELSQAHRLPYHHFNGVHVRSLIHPHWVILESSRRIRCTSCYTRVFFPRLLTWGDVSVDILEHISHFLLWRWSSSHGVVTILFIQLRDSYSHYWSQYWWFMPRWAWPLGFDCLITYDSSVDHYVEVVTVAPVDYFSWDLITTKKVLFCTFNSLCFKHFCVVVVNLYSNWHVKDLAMTSNHICG